ncbi:MAG: hypothetical protein MH472_03250 [Bacteroidia bacterium]|nr:hypothetical protein [Bacteroidia bacterium]
MNLSTTIRLIILSIGFIASNNLNAQQNIRYSELLKGDSISVQTTNGLFTYGFFIQHNDSLIMMSYREDLTDPITFKLTKIADIVLLNRKLTEIAKVNELTIEPRRERTDITGANNNQANNQVYKSELEKYKTPEEKPTSNRVVQIVLGSLAGYGGAVVGGIIGAGIGSSFDVGYSESYFLLGSLIGVGVGSIAATSYVVYLTGNTGEYIGSYKQTLKGTAIGFACGIIMYPFMPVFGATGGYIAHNKSLVKVNATR